MFYASQVFILRKKTHDELGAENNKFGTHKLINIKARHLGEDVKRATALVKLSDNKTMKFNYVNLDINNFNVEERADLVEMMKRLSPINIVRKPTQDSTF